MRWQGSFLGNYLWTLHAKQPRAHYTALGFYEQHGIHSFKALNTAELGVLGA